MKKLYLLLILLGALLLSIALFSIIYWYGNYEPQLTYDEALYHSVDTQCLLGTGTHKPVSTQMRAAQGIQAFITLTSILGFGFFNLEK